ncbi:hypothetical protein [Actinoplanes sp. NPDC089786]|uniref:hypothetical protein n=1 Tax=Actinoplanes sp. NPDC089786 TaxID=3155185 RepID=UPI0034309B53
MFDHPADTGRAFLLMAPDEGNPPAGLVAQIAAFADELSEAGSFLIVATTTSMWAAAGGYHDGSVLVVGPPDGHELLRKRVAFFVRRPDVLEGLDDQQIEQHAKAAAPDDVMRLADLLIEVARRTPDHLGSEEGRRKFVEEVVHAYLRWEAELGDWFQNRTDAADRLFLLAVAALEGSPAPVVLRAAEDLGGRLGLSRLGISGIESAGIRQLAKTVQAEVRPDTTIHFKRPAYRTAVLDFVLSDRSEHVRRALQRWLADLPSPNHAPKVGTATAVAEVVLDLARRHRDVGFPIAMVAGWKRQERLRDVLVELLTAVALSPEAGGPSVRVVRPCRSRSRFRSVAHRQFCTGG